MCYGRKRKQMEAEMRRMREAATPEPPTPVPVMARRDGYSPGQVSGNVSGASERQWITRAMLGGTVHTSPLGVVRGS
jgi:hypothetical protein